MSKQIEFGDRNGGSWGTVKTGRKGWTVETFSRWIGSRTDRVMIVPFDAPSLGIAATDDLTAEYNPAMTRAEAIVAYSVDRPELCKVRRRGDIVE